MKQSNIIFHADDFGANEEISENILECYGQGALCSISILPNSDRTKECISLLNTYEDKLLTSIHFNLAEGHCMAKPEQVPLLVNEKGMFSISFFKVLLYSFTWKRGELEKELTLEMRAQLESMLPYVKSIRVDSHQHYHLIPIVLKSILRVIREKNLSVDFIRIPAEPITPFLKHPGLYGTYRPINFIKNFVLNTLNVMDYGLLKPYRNKTAVFFGILLSGGMDLKRVKLLMPDFLKIAEKRGIPLEILCHPGGVENPEKLMDKENADCVQFYLSDGRKEEKNMLMHICE